MNLSTLRTLLCGFVLLLAFGLAGGCDRADAAVTPPPAGWGNAYQAAALDYWGGATPDLACATYTMTFDSDVPASHGGYVGWATIPDGMGTDCHLDVGPMAGQTIYIRCVVYAHEYGHTLGMNHVSDPSMVMYGGVLGTQTEDVPCKELVQSVHSQRVG